MMILMNKKYSELIKIEKFEDRFDYLRCNCKIGDFTFGGHRQLNQLLYRSTKWKKIRDKVIIRDDGLDLAHPDYPICGSIYVHHINPITIDDILDERENVFDPENLISTSFQTHNAIHFGSDKVSIICSNKPVTRKPNDTCPWKG